jgi:hypothetical protein
LDLKLYEGGEHGEKLKIDFDAAEPSISFIIVVENKGDVGAIISDNLFKNQCELGAGKTAITHVNLKAEISHPEKRLKELLKMEPIVIHYRLVYYPINTKKEFYSIERNFRLTESDIELI